MHARRAPQAQVKYERAETEVRNGEERQDGTGRAGRTSDDRHCVLCASRAAFDVGEQPCSSDAICSDIENIILNH